MHVRPLNAILVVVGLLLVGLNFGLGAYATGEVPDAVREAVETKVKDDICENTSQDYCYLYPNYNFECDASQNIDDCELYKKDDEGNIELLYECQ